MSAENSTVSAASGKPTKPSKPYPDYPLYAHAAGVWAKKIRGTTHYFGPWDDPDGALKNYLDKKDALHAGRQPRPDPEALTVKDMANLFLNAKQARVDHHDLSPRTWQGYKEAADEVVAAFGKRRLVIDLGPADFSTLWDRLAKRWGPVRLGNVVQYVRTLFKFAYDSDLIDRPVRFGPTFKKPTRKTLRIHRAKSGAKLFTAEEILRLIDNAGQPLKAMILLGINCGFGNADCGRLPMCALDLEQGWIDYPRPKTGIPRRCPLWSETMQALREALANRPEPKDPEHAGLVFVTKYGNCWAKDTPDGPITKETTKLLRQLDMNGHRSFYSLRHTHRTVADEAKDQPAADFLMGHESPHMSTVYRERISDERLKAVTDYVRRWLFGRPEPTEETPTDRFAAGPFG
jgi:integrase